jgi:LysR family glycine cleavage system transcriptional activator
LALCGEQFSRHGVARPPSTRTPSTRIPSIQALRALDAFARQGSVWKAAEEVGLTRSAVSHQLRLLERDLGFELLRRVGKGVGLTARGRRYVNSVRKALALIGEAAMAGEESGVSGPFVISCTPGFASLWLCTHIGEFFARYPDVAIRLLTPRRLDEAANPEADVFIAFGDGNWPNRTVELLSEVSFAPLCSPVLLNRAGGFSAPADLLKVPLLHLAAFDDWSRWFALAGVELPDPEAGIIFSDMNLLLAATAAGQGVALGDALTCGRSLAEGTLVRPFDLAFRSTRAYYLVMEPQKAESAVARAFTEWLHNRLAETAPGLDAPRRAIRTGRES